MSDLELVKRTSITPVADKQQELLLIERLKQKDSKALSEIYDAHSSAVFGSLLQFIEKKVASEVLLDAFVKLWEQPESFDPSRANLRVFLLVIARSRALERQRSRKDPMLIDPEPEPEVSLLDVRPMLEGDSYKDAAWQRREELRLAVQDLSSTHHEVLLRTFVTGESREAIARDLDIPVSTITSRLNFALGELRKAFDHIKNKNQHTSHTDHSQHATATDSGIGTASGTTIHSDHPNHSENEAESAEHENESNLNSNVNINTSNANTHNANTHNIEPQSHDEVKS